MRMHFRLVGFKQPARLEWRDFAGKRSSSLRASASVLETRATQCYPFAAPPLVPLRLVWLRQSPERTGKDMERRLAAILAADVVGYGRLLEQDEAGTLASLKARRRDILNPLVAEHHGRIIKVMGDGVLVEFGSAVNAVACAIELQRRMAASNEGLAEG